MYCSVLCCIVLNCVELCRVVFNGVVVVAVGTGMTVAVTVLVVVVVVLGRLVCVL